MLKEYLRTRNCADQKRLEEQVRIFYKIGYNLDELVVVEQKDGTSEVLPRNMVVPIRRNYD